MIPGFDFRRVFAMPALEGLRSLRIPLLANPGMPIADAVAIIEAGGLDVQGLDVEASAALLQLVPANLPNEGPAFYRGCVRSVLLVYQPYWIRVMAQGRIRFYSALERDEQSLFRETGILNDPPDDEFVEWWDKLTGELRLIGDIERMDRARSAERFSIAHEIDRLAREGIEGQPKWTGLDDNTKGYDVQSFERVGNTIVNKLIEVKSTVASPLRFRLTRNEWDQACKFGAAYVFHIWDMQKDPPSLYVRTVDQVAPHVPTDGEKGRWKDVEISVGI